MQEVHIENYPNTSGWHIVHDQDTQMYSIRSSKGHKVIGRWTSRRFAEVALQNYLENLYKKDLTKKSRGRPPKCQPES